MTVRSGVLALWLALAAAGAFAGERPGVELAPFAGHRFGGGVTDATSGNGASLDAAASFGLIADVPIRRGAAIELLVSRQNTGVDLERYPEIRRFAVTVDHWMAGVRAAIPADSATVHPFLAVYLGLTRLAAGGGGAAEGTRVTAALGGGAVFDVAEHLGLRLDARAYAVFSGGGAAVACGGGGCSGAFGGDAMVQGEVAAALVLRL